MYDVKVYMETITPVWTGDAFNKGELLKPQSIIGSLRFWLEVFCYAAGELHKSCNKEELDQNKFMQKINELLEGDKELSIVEAKIKALRELGISIPSQVFGCNGWEGFIKIKEIKQDSIKSFNNPLKLPNFIQKNENDYNSSKWYLGIPYFWGKCDIIFEMSDKSVAEEILYPLLNFIQKYGFIGGKNNLGYGRVNFNLHNIKLSIFNEFKLNNKTKMIDNVIEEKGNFEDLFNDDLTKKTKIGLYKLQNDSKQKEFIHIIKKLIREKNKWRTKCKINSTLNDSERHYKFGSICRDIYKDIKGPNATKIIPWINKISENEYEYGFISLVLLQNFWRR